MWQRIGRVLIILLICGLAVIYVSTWLTSFNDPDELKAADFVAFYAAGRIAQHQGYTDIYNIDLQKNVTNDLQGRASDQFLLYNHLPYFVPVLALVVDEDYHASFMRWVLILLLIYLLSILILIQSIYGKEALVTRLMLTGGALIFTPLFISLWQGQDTAFLFLGLVLWCMGVLRKNDWLAAGGLAFVTVRPHLCIVLVAPLIFKHRHILWRFIPFAGLAGIYSLLLVRVQGVIGFLNLLKISAQGEWFGMNPQNMPNLTGLVYRLLHSFNLNVINAISWILFAIGIALIGFLWFHAKSVQEPLLGLSILIAALFAPHLHIHDLTILILPLLFANHNQKTDQFSPQAIILLPIASFAFLIGLLVNSLYFIVPYVVCAALVWNLAVKIRAEKESISLPAP